MSYFELTDEDRPPEQIWLNDEALESHWNAVEQRRNAKFNGDNSTEAVPQAGKPLEQNELTAQFKRGK